MTAASHTSPTPPAAPQLASGDSPTVAAVPVAPRGTSPAAAAVPPAAPRGTSPAAAAVPPAAPRGTSPAAAPPATPAAPPIEEHAEWQLTLPFGGAVAVLALHAQLPSLAWAFAQAAPGTRLGYVQTAGGPLTDAQARELAVLRAQGLLAGHISAGGAEGGDAHALSAGGALYHGVRALGWDAAVCGPGPELCDTGAQLGPAGLVALESAHAALALGCPTVLVPQMSSGARGSGGRGVSNDTLAVLDLLLAPVSVALPAGLRSPVGADLRAGLGAVFGVMRSAPAQLELDVARPARVARHDWRRAPVDLPAYAASGLPAQSTAPGPTEDPLFVATALAAGTTLAELVAEQRTNVPAEERAEHSEQDTRSEDTRSEDTRSGPAGGAALAAAAGDAAVGA